MTKFSFAGPSEVLDTRRERVEPVDVMVATLTFGWTCGFGYFVLWCPRLLSPFLRLEGMLSSRLRERKSSTFISSCVGRNMHILTCWALQVQFLLQIIVNRLCILQTDTSKRIWLKAGVATLITAVNISVYCIWVPARLNVSTKYIAINAVWDRCEKSIYLVVDGLLNYYFIRTISKCLLSLGLTKYDSLVKFNKRIIFISLSMDVLIIAMMSYPNDFVYMQYHPVAYLVKLNIEMAMSDLMVKIAAEGKDNVFRSKHHAAQGKEDKFVVLEQTAVKIGYDSREGKNDFSTCSVYGMESHKHLYTATISATKS